MTQHDASGETPAPTTGPLRLEDPWYDELASGRVEWEPAPQQTYGRAELPGVGREASPGAAAHGSRGAQGPGYDQKAAVYLNVQRSQAFQDVRRSHRRFVFPATVGFLAWYLTYIVTATAAPGLMAQPVGEGPLNIGMLAGLGQFLTTGILTVAYVHNARTRRDRAAFELRWDTQLRTRGVGR